MSEVGGGDGNMYESERGEDPTNVPTFFIWGINWSSTTLISLYCFNSNLGSLVPWWRSRQPYIIESRLSQLEAVKLRILPYHTILCSIGILCLNNSAVIRRVRITYIRAVQTICIMCMNISI